MRGEHPAVAGDNTVLFVDQHRVGEAKFAEVLSLKDAGFPSFLIE
jgi:hypothetical protein